MAPSNAAADRRVLSPREMLSKAQDNTEVMRLQTKRDTMLHLTCQVKGLDEW